MFFGSIPALVTPFAAGRVNEAAFRELVEWQIDEGSNGLVPCGTTGEAATLTTEEHRRLIEITVEVARGRVPVIAGCGSNNTAHAIELTSSAKAAGADAVLHVPPYYNRPNQDGIYNHLAAVADLGISVVLYNVPARTITDIAVETMARLSRLPNVIAVKDATGNLGRVSDQRRACGEQFVQLSGNDETALAFNAMGGVGCISVSANVAPRLCAEFQEAMREGRWDEALVLQDRLYPLHTALFTDASPGPVKYAMSRVRPGFSIELRAPMTEPSDASRKAVDAALAHAGLI
ncbi:4-hydroxy-tetrahydrodipicolinate synthase [Sphingomonas sp. NSE70-1]|uniref:4-hydroxy-tetrahydrodipicolinate synthase n=1 Tax=Sphingomonas caseinilyticus TaxID=2908205 RepID=A0ABT0RRV5_9SPHN|nr:4-hydroxy-tetrahydrodipicolinate synthase [Sphingomonas caseinilyticus]MCL6697691.1 4-hydroxy-tetrahydrodipicolinate synthase [Sphingomonas caseinilyticus]